MSDYRHWTSDEEKYIQDHWRLQTDGEMAAALDRSEGAVRTKRRELRCSPQKTWTPEELQYLEDHWGTVSIPGIAKKLGRTVNAIKVRVARMGLGGMLNSGDYVTFNQLMRELTDNGQSYSYQMKSWVKNRGMPIHTKRVNACSFRVVYLEEFWEWAEQHRSFIDFSKLEPVAFANPEPEPISEPEPVLEPEKIRPWNGFVHIRCEACHKESTTCLRTPTDTYICKECGHEMPLPKAYRAYTRCECGQKGAYLTNITDWAFDIPCVRCGSPNTVTYNPGRDCYGPVGSTQRRTKPRKKK